MKKLVLLAGVLALAAGCQKTELPDAPKTQQKGGLAIEASLADAATKGYYYENGLKMGWYAETDRIGLMYKNLKKGSEAVADPAVWNNWTSADAPAAHYKATTSGSRGYFTSADDANTLSWAKDAEEAYLPGEIAAYYPYVAAAVTAVGGNIEVAMPNIATQEMTDIKGTNATKYDFMTARAEEITPREEFNSVGETILGGEAKLTFKSHMAVLKFQLKNVKKAFGKFQSIEIKALGDKDNTKAASAIAFKDDKGVWQFADSKSGEPGAEKYVDGMKPLTDADTLRTITLNASFNWSDENAYAYIATLPVKRQGVFTAEKPELVRVTYAFEHMTYIVEVPTANDWVEGTSIAVPVMDFNTIPVYVVENSGAKHLYVNEGFGAKPLTGLINGSDVVVGNVKHALSSFVEVVSTEDNLDLTGLEKFTALTDVTIANATITKSQMAGSIATLKNIDLGKNVTSIPSKFFEGASALATLKGAGVTTIAADAFTAQSNLTCVELPSYKYNVKSVRDNMLNPATLACLDFSAVEVIGTAFTNDVPSLAGFEKLTDVVLNPNGVSINNSAFKGCKELANIENMEAIKVRDYNDGVDAIGEFAFFGCEKLVKAYVPGSIVAKSAFEGAVLLKEVVYTGNVVTVDNNAFKGCKALVKIDLPAQIGEAAFANCISLNANFDNVESLGKSAFSGCTALVGEKDPNHQDALVLNIRNAALTSLPASAFANIGAKFIKLHYVTKLGDASLNSGFDHISIIQKFAAAAANDKPFKSNVTAVTLFVNVAQSGITGNVITLGNNEVTFKEIVKSNR